MNVRLPRLLDGSFNEACRLRPGKLSATINLHGLSTASMTLPEGEPTVGLRQWAELYGPNGSLGLYRTTSPGTAYGTEQRVKLEHGLTTLGDSITPADTTLEGTPTEILTALLGYQEKAWWRLGTVAATGTRKLKVNRTNLLQAVLSAVKLFHGYALTYDFTARPWTLGLAALSGAPTCECRLSRNMAGVTVTRDERELCTRVYATGLEGGYLDADTVSTWGVIAKPLGTPEDADESEVRTAAEAYLRDHKNPTISAEVDALDLSEQTGEPLDAFAVGRLCRVALPDYGTTVNERVVTVSYADLLNAPERARLSLSTQTRDASSLLASVETATNELAAQSTGHGSGIRRNYKRLTTAEESLSTAWIRIDEDNALITLYAAQTNALEGRVSQAEIDVDGANAAITLEASRLDSVAGRVTQAEIRIDGANAEIALKVSRDGVIGAINVTPEEIRIQAKRINLSGYVTASQLSASLAQMATVSIVDLTVGTHLQSNGGATFAGPVGVTGDLIYKSSQVGRDSLTVVTGINVQRGTIHYTYGGANYSVNVVLNVSADTEDINYLNW